MDPSRSPGPTLSLLPASCLPSVDHPMLSGPPLTLAATTNHSPECGLSSSFRFPGGAIQLGFARALGRQGTAETLPFSTEKQV